MNLPVASVVWAAEVDVVVDNIVFGEGVEGIKVVDFGVVEVAVAIVVEVEVPLVVVVEVIEGMVLESK